MCLRLADVMPSMSESRTRSRSPHLGKETAADSLVPIIDISALISGGDESARAATAKKIGRACEDIGFFIVVNHGVSTEVMEAAWQKMLEFFDLPLAEKLAMQSEDEAKYPYGYSPLGAEILSIGKQAETAKDQPAAKTGGDMKEMMQIGPADEKCGMPARRMPPKPDGFKQAVEIYYESMNTLAHRLLEACAVALGLPESWFDDKIDRHIAALRAINYPDQNNVLVPSGSIRASAHTDYGAITILRSGGPGLQVAKDKENPDWRDVPYIENGFVINLGDLMRRWTNERWLSTLHRVVNPPEGKAAIWGRRMAMAFFYNLNKDAVVEAIPSCVSAEHPVLYDPIVAGEFLMLKHLASNGKADANAHFQKRIPMAA